MDIFYELQKIMFIKKEYNDCEENKSISQTRRTIEIVQDIDRYNVVLCLIFFLVINLLEFSFQSTNGIKSLLFHLLQLVQEKEQWLQEKQQMVEEKQQLLQIIENMKK